MTRGAWKAAPFVCCHIANIQQNNNPPNIMAKNQKNTTDQELTLYLTLKEEWYHMIESGEKTEEYRENKLYWCKRL